MAKRFLALLLCFALCLSLLPVSFAEDIEIVDPEEMEETLPEEEITVIEPVDDPGDHSKEEDREFPIGEIDGDISVPIGGWCGDSDNLTWWLRDNGQLEILGSGAMKSFSSLANVPWAAYRQQITSVSLPNGLTTIGPHAFECLHMLKTLRLPERLETIGVNAICDCMSLTTVWVPASVLYIDYSVFADCPALTDIYYGGSEEEWESLYGRYLSGVTIHYAKTVGTTVLDSGSCGDNLSWTLYLDGRLIISGSGNMKNYNMSSAPWNGNRSRIKSVELNGGATSIGYRAFYYCRYLYTMTIPESVTNIGENALPSDHDLDDIYYGGSEGEWLNLYGSVPEGTTMHYAKEESTVILESGNCGANGSNLTYTLYLDGRLLMQGSGDMKGSQVVSTANRSKVKSVLLPENVTSIGKNAFYGCEISYVKIPDSVTSIGEYAFAFCKSLRSLTIPENVNSIGNYAFGNCKSLSEILVQDNNPSFSSENGALYDKGLSTLLCWPGGKADPFQIPSSVTTIGDYACCGCVALQDVVIPSGVTTIGMQAFTYCASLRSLEISDSVTYMGILAFSDCDALRSVTIPGSISTISEDAFAECDSLTNVTILEGIKKIDARAFANCPRLDSVSFPDSLSKISFQAFMECGSLASVVLPASLERMEEHAFSDCGLYSIVFRGPKPHFSNVMGYCDPDGSSIVFENQNAMVYYRFAEESWNNDARKNYGGALTWYGYYEVRYNANGGEGAPQPDIKLRGSTIQLSGEKPQRNGYIFLGWASDPNTTEVEYEIYGDYTKDEEVTLYAVWEKKPVPTTLTLDRESFSLAVFNCFYLYADTDEIDTVLQWMSSDEDIATVDGSGLVTAHRYGKATITVMIPETDLSASCEVQTLFWDVTDSSKYYFKHVYWAAEKGITKGYDLEYFDPQGECTREQMMTFLWRLAGKPNPKTMSSPFFDVYRGSYYYKAVLWGAEQGITNGYSSGEYAGKFGVGLPCTREQAMTFLWRMAGKPNPKTTTNKFSDVKKSDYFYKAVLWASENKIANGYSDGTYGVGLDCLREHMVTFLSRYASKFM